MRAPHRDRRRPALATLCLALILICAPAAAEEATFRVLPGGTAYEASIVVTGSEHTLWSPESSESGFAQVEDLKVLGPDGPVECGCRWGVITFPEGNYTITYRAPVRTTTLLRRSISRMP